MLASAKAGDFLSSAIVRRPFTSLLLLSEKGADPIFSIFLDALLSMAVR